MGTYNPFTEEEKEITRANYYTLGAIGTAKLLPGRSRDVVKQWAHNNGLKVSKEYRSAVSTRINLKYKRNMSEATRKRIGDGHRKNPQGYCVYCGKKLTQWKKRCFSCYSKTTSGENNNNWRGGVAKLRAIVETTLRQLWKIPIFIRDNSTCQICGATRNLHVHHLRKYIDIRDSIIKANPGLLVNSVEGKYELAKLIIADHKLGDGITLCKPCHSSIHRNKGDELLGSPREGNQQPSWSNVISIVDQKVQRAIGEDSQANKPNTSVPHGNVMMCSELHV